MPELLLGMAVNTVVEKENSWLASWGAFTINTQLYVLGVCTFLVYSLESTFEYLYTVKWWRLAQDIQHHLRVEAFNHVQHSTLESVHKQNTGSMMGALNDDINQLERFLEEGVDSMIEILMSVLLIGGVFFYLSPSVAKFAMTPVPAILGLTYFFHKKLGPCYAAVREKAGSVGAQLANSLLGLTTVKSLVAERIERQALTRVSQGYRQANYEAIKWGALISPIIRCVVVIGFLVTLVYGGVLTLEGSLNVGAYTTLVFSTQRLLWPFMDISEVIVDFQRAMGASGRAMALFELPLEHSPQEPVKLRGRITFENVSFAYQHQTASLRNLSFDITPGQTAAFVGATGAGKTTLLKLLMGFHMPTAGRILFDGQSIQNVSLSSLRKQIGFVGQEPFLFEGTVAENINYAFPNATPAQTEQAAKQAAAHEFIMRLPAGYDTFLAERGQALSGGQRQRITIARALVRHPAVLILDEATSAVDNETELAIQKSLAEVSQDKTTLIIAHRLSTIKHADRIFVLKAGEIVEQGTHEALLEQDYLYANLWRLQTGQQLTHAELLEEEA